MVLILRTVSHFVIKVPAIFRASSSYQRVGKGATAGFQAAAGLTAFVGVTGMLMLLGDSPSAKDATHEKELLTQKPLKPTTSDVWGPFYVANAPRRAKVSPVYAQGNPLIVTGRILDINGNPLPLSSLDIWQTSTDSEYDYYEKDGRKHEYKEQINLHGASRNYDYRVRMSSDEHGRYEFETVKPPPYFDEDDGTWRCPHIHYYVQSPGHVPLVTQLYFHGEPKNDVDTHIDPSRTIQLQRREHVRKDGTTFVYFVGNFDIVLKPAQPTLRD